MVDLYLKPEPEQLVREPEILYLADSCAIKELVSSASGRTHRKGKMRKRTTRSIISWCAHESYDHMPSGSGEKS